MDDRERFKRMKKRGKLFDRLGILLTVLGETDRVKENKPMNRICMIGGCGCAIGSFVTHTQLLERYGVTEDVDDIKITAEILVNIVAAPILSTIFLGKSLRESKQQW